MTIRLVVFQLIAAVTLFFLLNWIGRHAAVFGYHQLTLISRSEQAFMFNMLLRCVGPVVFVILLSAGIYGLGLDPLVENIYLVVVAHFLLRWAFNLAWERRLLINWPRQITIGVASSMLAYAVYVHIIEPKRTLVPDSGDIANEVWLVILLFIYHISNQITLSAEANERRKARYLRQRYGEAKVRFGELIARDTRNADLEALAYAVLIYESFNRPTVARTAERILQHVGLAKTTGIMQVTSEVPLSDKRSVELGIAKLVNDYAACLKEAAAELQFYWTQDPGHAQRAIRAQALRKTAARYNRDENYVSEVIALQEEILRDFYPDASEEAPSEDEISGAEPQPLQRDAGLPVILDSAHAPDPGRVEAVSLKASGSLADLLEKARAALLDRNYDFLVSLAANEHYRCYYDHFEGDKERYVATLIEVRTADGQLGTTWPLRRIRKVRFVELQHNGVWLTVVCQLVLDGMPSATALLRIVSEEGRLFLTGELG